MAAISLGTPVCAGSNSTVADAASRLTVARLTPEVDASLRSTLRAQLPKVMPVTGMVTVSAVIYLYDAPGAQPVRSPTVSLSTAMRTLLQDLVCSFRQMRRSPGFALTAVLSLTLGIGATT